MADSKNKFLSIVNYNSCRRKFDNQPHKSWKSFLEQMIEESQPDICFLPGHDKTFKRNIMRDYGQYPTPNADGTVLLYNNARVSMKSPHVNVNGFGPLGGLDINQMVFPQVEIRAPAPINNIVKEFCAVSWKNTMWTDRPSTVTKETLAEHILTFSQRLAVQTRRPVLIGGEMDMDYNTLMKIAKSVSKGADEMYLSEAIPDLKESKFLPSMTRSVTKPERDLFRMNVLQCDSCQNQENDRALNSGPPSNSCFIASKSLHMSVSPKSVNIGHETGCTNNMVSGSVCQPMQVQMEIPVRPPIHHGG